MVHLIRRLVVATCLALGATLLVPYAPHPELPSHALGFRPQPRLVAIPRPRRAHRSLARLVQPRARPIRIALPTRSPVPLGIWNTVLGYPAPPIQASAAFLMDMRTGKILYEKNPDARLPMASTTKITTAIVTLQHARLSDLARTSARAASIGESTMVLKPGERLSVRDLLYGLLLNSANDAAITLAEHVAGSQVAFVRMMNALARKLHMRNTHYETAHGLDAPEHYSSARDLAIVARYAMRNPVFRRIVATTSYHIPATKHNQEHWLASVNRVIYWYPGVDGVKPGDTDRAGLCQVVSAARDGKHLLAVLLNTPTLVIDIRNLLNFGFRDFRWVQAPAWWDGPSSSLAGGSGAGSWVYYVGAGHYIRGLFLAYFKTHGGLQTFGYPRTEEIEVGGLRVQFFQGGELVYDAAHRTVYPADLGFTAARSVAFDPAARSVRPSVAASLAGIYRLLGGSGVFGTPVTGLTRAYGHVVQFFQYGALGLVSGAPGVVPLGDIELRSRGWLTVNGAADSYPPSLTPWWTLSFPAPINPNHSRVRTSVSAPRIVQGRKHTLSVARLHGQASPHPIDRARRPAAGKPG